MLRGRRAAISAKGRRNYGRIWHVPGITQCCKLDCPPPFLTSFPPLSSTAVRRRRPCQRCRTRQSRARRRSACRSSSPPPSLSRPRQPRQLLRHRPLSSREAATLCISSPSSPHSCCVSPKGVQCGFRAADIVGSGVSVLAVSCAIIFRSFVLRRRYRRRVEEALAAGLAIPEDDVPQWVRRRTKPRVKLGDKPKMWEVALTGQEKATMAWDGVLVRRFHPQRSSLASS